MDEDEEWSRLTDNAWRALRMLGPDAAPAVPRLIGLLSDPNSREAFEAGEVVRTIGPQAAPATPVLLAMLEGPPGYIRPGVVQTLGCIEARPELVVPVYRRCLEETNAHVRDVALQGLLNCGALAAWAEPEVAPLLLFTNSDDRRAALRVLIAAGTMRDETRLQVAGLLHDVSQSVVALAALALGRETPIDRELHRFVADSLTGPLDRWSSVFLQWPTAAALGLAGTNAALFLPALRPLLNHPTNEVRRAVIKAVRRIEGRSR